MILTGVGGGSPGGSDTQVQFNDGGAFGGFGAWDGITFFTTGAEYSRTDAYKLFAAEEEFDAALAPIPDQIIAVKGTLQTATGNAANMGTGFIVFDGDAIHLGPGTIGTMTSFGTLQYNAQGTVSGGMRVLEGFNYQEGGSADEFFGFDYGAEIAGGAVTTAYGIRLLETEVSGGTLTNHYGLFIGDFAANPASSINRPIDYAGKFVVNPDGSVDLAADGVRLSAADGVLTILGRGNGADESLTIDLDNAGANTVGIGTGTGVTKLLVASGIGLTLGGATGVQASAALGVLTLAGVGNTNNENLTVDFETTANMAIISSGSGVATLRLASQIAAFDLDGDASVLRFGASNDTIVAWDAANTLALRNSTNGQILNIYDTFTNSTNYERLQIGYVSGAVHLGTKQAGTGSAQVFNIVYSNSTSRAITVNASTAAIDFGADSSLTALSTGYVRVLNGQNSTATSGTTTGLAIPYGAAPSSTSTLAFQSLLINPTINYSNGTPGAGSYTTLKIAVTETALPTGTNYLLRASAGAAGTTDKFLVTNGGAVTMLGGLTINSATLIATTTTFTDGAGAQVGTLTNAPTAGNPSKWIPINDNGTTRYIPAWT